MGFCCKKSKIRSADFNKRPSFSSSKLHMPSFSGKLDHASLNENKMVSNGSVAAFSSTLNEPMMYTVKNIGNSLTDFANWSFSCTLTDEVGGIPTTNRVKKVLAEDVDRFVDTMLRMKVSEHHKQYGDGVFLSPPSTSATLSCGNSCKVDQLVFLTAEQKEYIHMGTSTAERLSRLEEVEQMTRQEIIGAWTLNTTLAGLALKRVVPTIRCCNELSEKQQKEVIVICARDVDLNFDEHTELSYRNNSGDLLSQTHYYNNNNGIYNDTGESRKILDSKNNSKKKNNNNNKENNNNNNLFTREGGIFTTTTATATNNNKNNKKSKNKNMNEDSLDFNKEDLLLSQSGSLNSHFRRSLIKQQFQVLGLTAANINIKDDVKVHVIHDTWDFLSIPQSPDSLNAGETFFRFVCSPVRELSQDSLELIDTFINLSSFANELAENNVPFIDINSAVGENKYVAILVKAMYLLPGVCLSRLTPELLASIDYQRSCQPGNNKVESTEEVNTFRVAKTIIRFVFTITIQMKVSEINDPQILQKFKNVDGLIPVKILLLERTKRNIYKIDSTVKVRSVLMYYAVNDGILVTHQTIVLNSGLPTALSTVLHSFGSRGAAEAASTVKQTRKYLVDLFGDSRF